MADDRKKFDGVKCTTPIFRASYLQVFEPKAFKQKGKEQGEPKYSTTMLWPKDTDLKDMKSKMMTLAVGAWGKDKAKWPKNFRWPFIDGDTQEDASEHHAGMLVARADSKNPPGVFDQKLNDIVNKRDIFSGCFCKASLFMVPYENIGGKYPNGKSGIKLYLQGVQLIKKGEPFGNMGASKGDFEVVDHDESGADDGFTEGGDDDLDMGF